MNIEFATEEFLSGSSVTCPKCGQETSIFVSPQAQPTQKQPPAPRAVAVQKPPATFSKPDGDSGIAVCLRIIGLLSVVGGVFVGIIMLEDSRYADAGLGILASGVLSGCILLGFASLIEHTKASAERLNRIEILLQKAGEKN